MNRLLEQEFKHARPAYSTIKKLQSLNWKLQVWCLYGWGGDTIFGLCKSGAIWQIKKPAIHFRLKFEHVQHSIILYRWWMYAPRHWLAGYDEMSSDLLELSTCRQHIHWIWKWRNSASMKWSSGWIRLQNCKRRIFYRNFTIAVVARSHAFYTVKLILECNYLRPTSKYLHTETDTFNSHIRTLRQISNDLYCCCCFCSFFSRLV